MIKLQGIHKTFRVAKREAGFGRAVKALFSREYETIHALTDVGFTIREGETVGCATSAAARPGRSASLMPARSAWFSGSAASFGGMCP